jgi:hypothetical protein
VGDSNGLSALPIPGGSDGAGDGAAPDDRARERTDDTRKRTVELVGAIIIGIAAVLTAIAVYQGSGVDGTVQEMQTEAVGLTLYANDAYNDATAEEATERDWIFGYLTEMMNDQPAADILLAAMPVEVADLAAEWLEDNEAELANAESDSIGDPFSSEYDAYSGLPSAQLLARGDAFAASAQCALFSAEVAGGRGDNYGLATVFLAVALVVGGIAALLRRKSAQIILLTTAVLGLVLGAGLLVLAADEAEARAETAVDFFVDEDGGSLTADEAIAMADDTCPEPEQ